VLLVFLWYIKLLIVVTVVLVGGCLWTSLTMEFMLPAISPSIKTWYAIDILSEKNPPLSSTHIYVK
jgi:hypothetical protein